MLMDYVFCRSAVNHHSCALYEWVVESCSYDCFCLWLLALCCIADLVKDHLSIQRILSTSFPLRWTTSLHIKTQMISTEIMSRACQLSALSPTSLPSLKAGCSHCSVSALLSQLVIRGFRCSLRCIQLWKVGFSYVVVTILCLILHIIRQH